MYLRKIPQLFKQNKGFTLIELLIVIAIIAVLATAAILVYFSIQLQARDGKRKVDIDGLSKSIETSKNAVAGFYEYSSTKFNNDFQGGSGPTDPLARTEYCLAYSLTSAILPLPDPNSWNSGCPIVGSTTYSVFVYRGNLMTPLPDNTKSWTLCAKLEYKNETICKSGQIN